MSFTPPTSATLGIPLLPVASSIRGMTAPPRPLPYTMAGVSLNPE